MGRNRSVSLCLLFAFSPMFFGCDQRTEISFRAEVYEGAIACNGTESIDRLSLYLSDFKILVNGSWRRVEVEDERSRDVILLESSPCAEDSVPRVVPIRSAHLASARGLRFSVSVPEELNHLQPTLASYPLNRTDMYWSWQQGYKFLSLEGRTLAGPFVLHLGSTGCKSPAPVRPPSEPCTRPNRIRFESRGFSFDSDEIVLELGELVTALEGTRCTGNYTQSEACIAALEIMGINAETGTCEPDCDQGIFKTVRKP